MAREMLNQAMELPLFLYHSLTMAMDITHNLTHMDTTLEDMARDQLILDMELASLDMALLQLHSIHMEELAPLTEAPKDFQPMAMEFMEREMLMLSLAMELVMDLLPLPSIHMEDPAPTTEPHKDFPVMDTMDMDITSVMPTMDTTDTHMPTTVMPTTERDLLMLKPMLMLTTDTHTLTVTDMPTADTTDTHTLTDGESKMLTKS